MATSTCELTLPANRPLLRERVQPRPAALGTGEGADMLDHAERLVVGLFDEEAVVANGRGVLRADRRGDKERAEQTGWAKHGSSGNRSGS